MSSWVTIAAAVIGAAGTAYGASENKKAGKANAANQNAFLKAQQLSEKEARKLYDGLIKKYNETREEMGEDFTLRDFISNQVEALNDPQLKEAFYSSRNDDWNVAQQWADKATQQNVSSFLGVVDVLGGGSYAALIGNRNKAALGDDIDAAYARARELRSSSIPAGSVRKGPDGQALPNSRADKFEFNIAYEEVQKANDRLFAKTSQAINDDRTASERQQVQASSFLPFLNYAAFTTDSVTGPFNQSHLSQSISKLNNDAQLAGAALGRAVQNPLQPGLLNEQSGDKMMAQGTQLAVAALGNYFGKQGGGGGGGGYSTSGGSISSGASGFGTAVGNYGSTAGNSFF